MPRSGIRKMIIFEYCQKMEGVWQPVDELGYCHKGLGHILVRNAKTSDIVYCQPCFQKEDFERMTMSFLKVWDEISPIKVHDIEIALGYYTLVTGTGMDMYSLPAHDLCGVLDAYLEETCGNIIFIDQYVKIANIFLKDMRVAKKLYCLERRDAELHKQILINNYFDGVNLGDFIRKRMVFSGVTARDSNYAIKFWKSGIVEEARKPWTATIFKNAIGKMSYRGR